MGSNFSSKIYKIRLSAYKQLCKCVSWAHALNAINCTTLLVIQYQNEW